MYLGMSLMHRRVGIGTFEFVVDKVRTRLNGWEAKNLLLAGRITLAKAVLLTIPNYFMTTVRIPISVCSEIEKLARNFIQRSTSEARKPALINWEGCCQLIDVGGLGVHSLQI